MIKNASQLPKVYFGLHMVEGVAEYREPEKEPYRIMIGENAIKNMDPSFQGRPVYVRHVDQVDVTKIQAEADGYVVESFFNEKDGKHWAKFIVVSDRGHEAIRNGWKLSNAYIPKAMTNGGLWHGVEYSKEITSGEYEHLAIVPNPRYEESVIFTPEQFKEYNTKKEIELNKLANSKGESSMLNFFKKSKVENSADLEGMSIVLPKSKKELTVTQLVNDMDTILNMNGYANGDHMVKAGEEEMSVNDLAAKYCEMKNTMAAAEEEKKKNAETAEEEEKKKENEDPAVKAEEEKKKNEEPTKEEEKKKNSHFDALKNAPTSFQDKETVIDLSMDRVARGKSRYGSN